MNNIDSNGRGHLGEFAKEFGYKPDMKVLVVYKEKSDECILVPKERIMELEEIDNESTMVKLDSKLRFFIPAKIRKKYTNQIKIYVKTKEKLFYVKFYKKQ